MEPVTELGCELSLLFSPNQGGLGKRPTRQTAKRRTRQLANPPTCLSANNNPPSGQLVFSRASLHCRHSPSFQARFVWNRTRARKKTDGEGAGEVWSHPSPPPPKPFRRPSPTPEGFFPEANAGNSSASYAHRESFETFRNYRQNRWIDCIVFVLKSCTRRHA